MAFVIFAIAWLVLLVMMVIEKNVTEPPEWLPTVGTFLAGLCLGVILLCAIYSMFTVSFRAGLAMIGSLAFFSVSRKSFRGPKDRNTTPKSSAAKVDNLSNTLQSAIQSIKAGDNESGKHLLGQVIQADPKNEMAWLWWTQVVDSDEERLICLRKVLDINPNNELAKRGLAALQQKKNQSN